MNLAAITTFNHLAQATVLVKSFLLHNPKATVHLLLVDAQPHESPIKDKRVKYYSLQNISSHEPRIMDMAFRYEALELCCALKPFFIDHIFRSGIQNVIYLDCDMYVQSDFVFIRELLNHHNFVLTPHITNSEFRLKGRKPPTEREILISGTFNLGFLGVSKTNESLKLLRWWQERVFLDCEKSANDGLFYDQRWFDLVPGLFEGIHVLRHPGCNVAFWNLHERQLSKAKDKFVCGEQPLVFFHFSHFDPWQPQQICRFETEINLENFPFVRELVRKYRGELAGNGLATYFLKPYRLNYFDNGLSVPWIARKLYKKVRRAKPEFARPFDTKAKDSFFQWMTGDGTQIIPPLLLEMREVRRDVKAALPVNKSIDDDIKVLEWGIESGVKEFGLEPIWLRLFGLARMAAIAKKRAAQAESKTRHGEISAPHGKGVNLAGPASSSREEHKIFSMTKNLIAASSVPLALNSTDGHFARLDGSLSHLDFVEENAFNINIVHVNPWNLEKFVRYWGQSYFKSRYNIGYWLWEMSQFPEKYLSWLQQFDEIWVPTRFLQESLVQAGGPVVRMPIYWTQPALSSKKSEEFYTFGAEVDFSEFWLRKNLTGLIWAFKSTFSKTENVQLKVLIKNTQMASEMINYLRYVVEDGRISFIHHPEDYDCFVSLHHSEGFGVDIISAMQNGKSVISTSYGGPQDFLTKDNALLVDWEICKTKQEYGPYPKASLWANPNLDQAKELLRFAFEHQKVAHEIGRKGQESIKELFASDKLSKTLAKRLGNIHA